MRAACSGPAPPNASSWKSREIVTAHGGDRLDRLLHLHVDDADDAFGGVFDAPCASVFATCSSTARRAAADVELHLAAEEIVLAEIAEHDVAIGDRGLACRRGRSTRAPAPRPRFADRLRELPKRSTRASVPPPALTVLMSIIGSAMSRPSILPRLCTEGSPSLISATSQDVPPMSKVMRFLSPVVRQVCTLAVIPPAGPESTVATAFFALAAKRRHAAVRLHDVFLRRLHAGLRPGAIPDWRCNARGSAAR